MWWCLCACSAGTRIAVQGDSLVMAKTRSCGCEQFSGLPKAQEASFKHGHTSSKKDHACNKNGWSPTYTSWSSMLTRCYNPNDKNYHYYGGRGIIVCDRWRGKEGFANFLADMGERPVGTTLDRFPNNGSGNYEPGNCRWATRAEQLRNTRATKLTIEIVRDIRARYKRGEKIADIARQLAVDGRQIGPIVHGKVWKDETSQTDRKAD